MRPITHIVVHYSATASDEDIGVVEIDAMHRARGWKGGGYHYVIRRNGVVEKGRPDNEIGAHVENQNTGKLGICCVGGTEPGKPELGVDNRTPEQISSQIELIRKLLKEHPGAQVVGHRDLAPTQCPGFDAVPWWQAIQRGAEPAPTVATPAGAPASSDRLRVFLKAKEGEVLKAYRDAVGKWTIGVGLTAASGVVTPRAGMSISRAESDRLLKLALAKNYEPAVSKALSGVAQHAFDGAVSFHFNTGAIARASWVKAYKASQWAAVRSGLAAWKSGGGRVLPGLVTRRKEEADIIVLDQWPASLKPGASGAAAAAAPAGETPAGVYAAWYIQVEPEVKEQVRASLRQLGYEPGDRAGYVLDATLREFQRKHGLTVDGLIGKATLATLQRELDARSKSKVYAATTGGAAAAGVGNEVALADQYVTLVLMSVGVIALAIGLYLAWQYRDVIAARINDRLPRLAAWLRSF